MSGTLTISFGEANVSPVPILARFFGNKIVLLDNDETCGFFPRASLVYECLNVLYPEKDKEEFIPFFIREFFNKGGVRPGLKEFLQNLNNLKRESKINKLGIFTSASNKSGWVSFLCRCYEVYADVKFDIVYDRDKVDSSETGRIIKDLRLFCHDLNQVLIIDDKPENVYGKVLAIPEYRFDTNLDSLTNSLPISTKHKNIIREYLDNDKQKFPFESVNPTECFLEDDYLKEASEVIHHYFTQDLFSNSLKRSFEKNINSGSLLKRAKSKI